MGMTINDLPVAETVTDNDKLDMYQLSTGTDVGLPMSLLKNYIALSTNGIIRGSVTETEKPLDSFSAPADTGVWKWTCEVSQVRSDFPYTYGIVEIIRHEVRAGTDETYDYIQRISVGDAIYQRMKTATNSGAWSTFKRFDVDYDIKYGSDTYNGSPGQQVLFTTSQVNPGSFLANSTPRVFIMPINMSSNEAFYAQLYSTDANGFTFAINHQTIDTSSSGIPVIAVDFSNQTVTNASELSQYIADYCTIDRTTSCGFMWIAIAPKTVTPS